MKKLILLLALAISTIANVSAQNTLSIVESGASYQLTISIDSPAVMQGGTVVLDRLIAKERFDVQLSFDRVSFLSSGQLISQINMYQSPYINRYNGAVTSGGMTIAAIFDSISDYVAAHPSGGGGGGFAIAESNTESGWLTDNPVLDNGAIGYITDVYQFVIGNGVSNFTTLYNNPQALYSSLDYIQSQLSQRVSANSPITGATKTKITYDSKGLVTSGTSASTADVVNVSDVSGSYLTEALNSLYDSIGTIRTDVNSFGLYQEILLADFQSASAAGTLTPGKTYAITDLLSILGTWRLLLQGMNYSNNNGVANGTLLFINLLGYPMGSYDVQFDIINGTFLSFYNRVYDVRCTSEAMFTVLHNAPVGVAFYSGKITGCDFSNYTGTLTFDVSNNTTLKNCDFSNSDANFNTSELTSVATFSGRIIHDFDVPNQSSYTCDFTNTIIINADGSNNMMATITLTITQSVIDYDGFESVGILKIIPEPTAGNTILSIDNAVPFREYKIVSDDTGGYLTIAIGGNIIIPHVLDLFYVGLIQWNTGSSANNEVYFKSNGSQNFILSKTVTYP